MMSTITLADDAAKSHGQSWYSSAFPTTTWQSTSWCTRVRSTQPKHESLAVTVPSEPLTSNDRDVQNRMAAYTMAPNPNTRLAATGCATGGGSNSDIASVYITTTVAAPPRKMHARVQFQSLDNAAHPIGALLDGQFITEP
ncbi:MAG: hypothetical protein KF745_14930 [Phycisphaeraceae bacterium]|nr:hypothetical protein [Phycisphaeraceae bacterium]